MSYLGSWSTVTCTQQYQKIQLCAPVCGPVSPAVAMVNGDSYHEIHILPPPPPPPPHSHLPLFTSFGYNRSPNTSEEPHSGQGTDPLICLHCIIIIIYYIIVVIIIHKALRNVLNYSIFHLNSLNTNNDQLVPLIPSSFLKLFFLKIIISELYI